MQENTGTPLTTLTPTGGGGLRAPIGEYKTTFMGVVNLGNQYGNGDRLKFIFRIDEVESIDEYPPDVDVDDDDAIAAFVEQLIGFQYFYYCNLKFGPKADLVRIINLMTGKPLDGPLDISPYINKPFRLTLGMVEKDNPTGGPPTKKIEPIGLRQIRTAPPPTRRQAKPVEDEEFLDADV